MKRIVVITMVVIGWVSAASAFVIYDATPANSTFVYNAVRGKSASGSVTGTAGALVLTNSGIDFGMVGFASARDINTMKGTALTSTDTVTFKATIASITGLIRANGVEFGLSPSASYRPDGHLIYSMKADDALHAFYENAFIDARKISARSSEASMKDGFDISLVANHAGYTFTISGIKDRENGGATTITKSGTFTGTQFVDLFGGGHFYLAVQQYNDDGDTLMRISEAQISVTPAEPVSLGLITGAFGAGILIISRRFEV